MTPPDAAALAEHGYEAHSAVLRASGLDPEEWADLPPARREALIAGAGAIAGLLARHYSGGE